MIYTCCDEKRQAALRGRNDLNGIDTLEVADDQVTLHVTFINPLAGDPLTPANIAIEGGTRFPTVPVVSVAPGADDQARVLTVITRQPGDFSRYTFRLRAAVDRPEPPTGYDPRLAAIDFSFKVTCASDFDCRPEPESTPPDTLPEPEIDYQAKDYASFRQLLLDRLSLIAPQWTERNPADLGVRLVELLAYVGDYLSYQQDAVATEAYLATARRRVSVRRHARFIDYAMHDGCNARVWVCIEAAPGTQDVALRPTGPTGALTSLLTRCAEHRVLDAASVPGLVGQYHPEVFELLHAIPLYDAHNAMKFYTWGDERCVLRQGATRATLRDDANLRLRLRRGDVLVFEEQVGTRSGRPEDADLSHRHAVRLTAVRPEAQAPAADPFTRTAGDLVTDPLTGDPIVEVEWAAADALPFDLALSARGLPEVALAYGNVVLADHGRTVAEPNLGPVPGPQLGWLPAQADACDEPAPRPVPARFRPRLKERPLTQAAIVRKSLVRNGQVETIVLPFDPDQPAAASGAWDMADVLPAISLADGDGRTWAVRRDLLSSDPFDRHFVVETEEDGSANLRLGDGEKHGARPQGGATFAAFYRIGNGAAGNIGAEALWHIAGDDPALASVVTVRNPLPAQGGTEPERLEDVRQRAPAAFRVQERAVTADDYAEVAARHPRVQRAAAAFRWTGSWRTVFLTVDRADRLPLDEAFEAEMRRHLGRYRLAGYDLEIDAPRYVSLDIALTARVRPDHFRNRVKTALLDIYSAHTLPGGRRGIFHLDNFSFAQPVYLSALYAAAQAVEGVESVQLTTFQRQGFPSRQGLDDGKLPMGRLEIARLDNDPNFPEHGVFVLTLEGGK